MSLSHYGLLTGTLVDHGPQHGGNPHYLLFVRAGGVTYRVAVNLESTLAAGDLPPQLEYQIIDNLNAPGREGANRLAAAIRNQNAFVLKDQDPTVPTLDF